MTTIQYTYAIRTCVIYHLLLYLKKNTSESKRTQQLYFGLILYWKSKYDNNIYHFCKHNKS